MVSGIGIDVVTERVVCHSGVLSLTPKNNDEVAGATTGDVRG